jgi:hypothetical protein
MPDMKIIPGPGKGYTHGSDEFGEYGSIFRPEEDAQIPTPLDYDATPELERAVRDAESDEQQEKL